MVMNADGSHPREITTILNEGANIVWSPDSQHIAFNSAISGNLEVYIIDLTGANLTNLTNNPALDASPAWSPDGTQIAFHSNRESNEEIYTMNADGSNVRRLTNNPAEDIIPVWRP